MGKMCLTSVYMQAYVIKYNLIVKMYLNLLTVMVGVYCLFTTVFNLRFLKDSERLGKKQAVLDDEALISILIPARNESLAIKMCLQSLTVQTYRNLEILVLDDDVFLLLFNKPLTVIPLILA